MPGIDIIYGVPRALIASVIVVCTAAVARRRRVGYERHLLLFLAFSLIGGAEVMYVVLAAAATWARAPAGLLFLYPGVSTLGLLALAFALEFGSACPAAERELGLESIRSGRAVPVLPRKLVSFAGMAGGDDEATQRLRGRLRLHVTLGLVVAALTIALAARGAWHGGSVGAFREAQAPLSFARCGIACVFAHVMTAAAGLILLVRAWPGRCPGLTRLEARAFGLGCVGLILGVGMRGWFGPREVLTTLALGVFAAVLLRSLCREQELGAVRATEDRSVQMLLFHRVATELKSTFDLDHLYEILMDSLLVTVGGEAGAIFVPEPDGQSVRARVVRGPFPPPVEVPRQASTKQKHVHDTILRTRIPLGSGMVGRVAEKGEPMCITAGDFRRNGKRNGDAGPGMPLSAASSLYPLHSAVALPLWSLANGPATCPCGVVQVVNRRDGRPFDEDDVRFMNLIVEQANLAIHGARLHHETVAQQRAAEQLRVAREIQLKLIPTELPAVPGYSIHGAYRAAEEVGGDYYDILRIERGGPDDRYVGIVMADVAGKGVPGALVMIMSRAVLRETATQSLSAARTLAAVNDAIVRETTRAMFVTAAYAVLDTQTGEMTLASAGHDPVLVLRRGARKCEAHSPRGAALGLLPTARLEGIMEEERIVLGPGDTALFYTDGVTEARSPEGEEFGEKRLDALVAAYASDGPEALLDRVLAQVAAHAGDAPQYDDISLLALRRADVTSPSRGDPPGRPCGG